MGKKFRCGLLVVTENGDTRVIDLRNGGGSRDCYWDVTNMSFSQLHHRLLDLYQLSKKSIFLEIRNNSFILFLFL